MHSTILYISHRFEKITATRESVSGRGCCGCDICWLFQKKSYKKVPRSSKGLCKLNGNGLLTTFERAIRALRSIKHFENSLINNGYKSILVRFSDGRFPKTRKWTFCPQNRWKSMQHFRTTFSLFTQVGFWKSPRQKISLKVTLVCDFFMNCKIFGSYGKVW